jgi:hypothetical protein
MRDAALMEEEQLLEFLCPFTAETNHEWDYGWCVKNWGTKWDIFDVDVVSLDGNELEMCFTTAWSPPVKALQHGAKRYGFDFELTYKEEGMMFTGMTTPLMDNTYTYTFDVPPHEEMPCQLVDEWGEVEAQDESEAEERAFDLLQDAIGWDAAKDWECSYIRDDKECDDG